mgnify:FL=1
MRRLLLKPSILTAAVLSLTALTACGQPQERMITPIEPVTVSVMAAEQAEISEPTSSCDEDDYFKVEIYAATYCSAETEPENDHVNSPEPKEPPEQWNEDLDAYLGDLCKKYKVDKKLTLAIIECESAFQPDVISETDDYGLMQINKCNHEWLSEKLGISDYLDPRENMLAGVYMLSYLKQFADTEEKLIMCYAHGVNGARAKWSDGIVSTSYTQKVLRIKNGE